MIKQKLEIFEYTSSNKLEKEDEVVDLVSKIIKQGEEEIWT